jgi:predicted  nucleic acid-binding Zn-ribbon protein
MEPENLTVRLLQEIRDEVRSSSEKSEVRFEKMDQRAEVIETTLRDLAQQMVMLARGIKTALEHRSSVDNRLDDAERRLNDLEKRVGH